MAHEPIPYEMVDSFQSRPVSEIREELARKAIDGVLDEVKSATMTQNMELKKRLNQAAELLKDFPGHRDETEWNAWLFKRDRFISEL